MPDPTDDTPFQPERVHTFSEWRLPNYAPPVDEMELRRSFEAHADTANQVFEAFLTRIGTPADAATH